MKVFHQTGFRYQWNLDSYTNGNGDGLIYSPVNIDADRLLAITQSNKSSSFLDPQLYLLNEAKATLDTYPYFPGNIKSDFSTSDLDNANEEIAKKCVDYQYANGFQYLVIPTRYYDDNPSSFLEQSREHFVEPFVTYANTLQKNVPILLSVIVKQIMITDEVKRNEILNWITGHLQISGVYLIFENRFNSKQIKDFDYLLNVLRFIRILKANKLEVHIGYTNTEALLYSVAMPDSITIGGYENLRSFRIRRFIESDGSIVRSPNARLYSTHLLQWVDYIYIEAMKKLVPFYENFFDDTQYKPLMFVPTYQWHTNKPETYKHYFIVFNKQIKSLPLNQVERINVIKTQISNALANFATIKTTVLLDSDSDDSHLPTWLNVVNAFQQEL